MKYKPCCNRRCLVGNCKTREQGGCYCLCKLKDFENSLEMQLNGDISSGGCIYVPGKKWDVTDEQKEGIQTQLAQVRYRIKTYELA